MKLKYIFIPASLLTILVIGICKHYYNLELLSMNQVCMICVTSFVAFFTVFFGIYVCAYEASKAVVEQQDRHIDQYVKFLGQYINNCFEAHDVLTKDVVTQQSLLIMETMKELAWKFNEGDDKRAKVLENLLIDIKQLSLTTRDNSSKCKELVNESIERLDNVLICLRKEEALIDVDDIGDDEIRVIEK